MTTSHPSPSLLYINKKGAYACAPSHMPFCTFPLRLHFRLIVFLSLRVPFLSQPHSPCRGVCRCLTHTHAHTYTLPLLTALHPMLSPHDHLIPTLLPPFLYCILHTYVSSPYIFISSNCRALSVFKELPLPGKPHEPEFAGGRRGSGSTWSDGGGGGLQPDAGSPALAVGQPNPTRRPAQLFWVDQWLRCLPLEGEAQGFFAGLPHR